MNVDSSSLDFRAVVNVDIFLLKGTSVARVGERILGNIGIEPKEVSQIWKKGKVFSGFYHFFYGRIPANIDRISSHLRVIFNFQVGGNPDSSLQTEVDPTRIYFTCINNTTMFV